MKVKSIMTNDVLHVKPDCPLRECYKVMKNFHIHHLVVVEKERIKGIISLGDILYCSQLGKDGSLIVPETPVSEAMTRDVVTCNCTDKVATIADVMLNRNISAVPVVGRRKLIGIVTSTDLLCLLTSRNSIAMKNSSDILGVSRSSFLIRGWGNVS